MKDKSTTRGLLYIVLITLVLLFLFISIETGTTETSFIDIIVSGCRDWAEFQIINIRFLQSFAILISGICLAVSGLVLQRITRNNLVDPGITGVLSGSALGITLLSLIDLPNNMEFSVVRLVFSFAFGFLVGGLFTLVSLWTKDSMRSLIFGVILNSFVSGSIILIQAFLNPYELQQTFTFLMGGVLIPDGLFLVLEGGILVASILFLILVAKKLDTISLGDIDAHVLGIDIKVWRSLFVTVTVILSSTAVSLTGVVGFVGFVIPNIITLISYRVHSISTRDSIILSGISGGVFLLVSYIISRKLLPMFELPLGVITGLIGAPIFAIILFRITRED
ncbi:MAG: iron ABC transporter permease [Brevinematales bacterium]|nr:iron ABC transporter permease [Brevinematales bacterium]